MSNKPINLLELVEAIGVDNITLQRLDQSITGAKTTRHKDTEISFACGEPVGDVIDIFGGRVKRSALILWYDTDKWDAAVKKLKEGA